MAPDTPPFVRRYRTIVADPPWKVHQPPALGRGVGFPKAGPNQPLPYKTMSVAEIVDLPVESMADENCHLYVWTINRYVEDTYRIVRAWGFSPSILLTWAKTPMGMGAGGAYAQTTEFVLFARRGFGSHESRHPTTWWNWKRGAHSAKPEAFLDIVEQVSPGPYLEMFARRARFGWDYWGNESLGTAAMSEVS
jgi:N6-adenosine-specific RNA methylase IME4